MIMDDVAAGTLDLPTALLYRAYSALNLSGVPEKYMTGVPRRDDDVFQQMAVLQPTVSESLQAAYASLLVRPTDTRSVFAQQPTALIGGVAADEPEPTLAPPCHGWATSGDGDSRFLVHMCTDNGLGTATTDIGAVVQMIKDVWPRMTKPVPAGMGPPLADQYNAGSADDYGGDARIDFYVLEMGKGVYRDGQNQIPANALAVAYTAEPYDPRGPSSGFVVLNLDRLAWPVEFKADLIHEFFHVLQFAHSRLATVDSGLSHWFKEASAEWAETFYQREHSDLTHQWFSNVFQASPAGLEVNTQSHQYAAYIWPFFMEQEASESAVFNAWQAIGGQAPGDLENVSNVISLQLPFKDNFREFALRNLDLGTPLSAAGVKRYQGLDLNFPDGAAPTHMVQGEIAPGEPYISEPAPAPPLGAAYYSFFVALPAKEITLDLRNVSPADARDGDALVQVGGKWTRYKISDVLKLCEDDLGGNVDQIYLVVSDHDRKQPLLGTVEASAKEDCEAQTEIIGDITWDEQVVQSGYGAGADITHHAAGTAHVHAVWDPTAGWQTQNDSRYTLHYEQSDCAPSGTDSSGPLTWTDIYAQMPQDMGMLHVSGGPKEDLELEITMNVSWVAACSPTGDPAEPLPNAASYEFPGCARNTTVAALWNDSQSQYVVHCVAGGDVLGPGYEISGNIDGILNPNAVPSPQ